MNIYKVTIHYLNNTDVLSDTWGLMSKEGISNLAESIYAYPVRLQIFNSEDILLFESIFNKEEEVTQCLAIFILFMQSIS
jgi:hypothetical protein